MDKISIIVPWLPNGVERTPSCLASILRQQISIPVEIIIVANGPNAFSPMLSCPGASLIRQQKKGPAAARNSGVRFSTGDVLAFIDADCRARFNWLSSALATMCQYGSNTIIAGGITRTRERRTWVSLYDSVTYLRQAHYVLHCGAFVTANLVLHRTLFSKVGPFDEAFVEAACEDWDWAMRARSAGMSVYFDEDANVEHPCMSRLTQLRSKAQRLSRGNQRLSQKSGQADSTRSLLATIGNNIQRGSKHKQLSLLDRLRVMSVSIPVAYWTWKAARINERRL